MPTTPGWPSSLFPRQIDPLGREAPRAKPAVVLQYPPPGQVLLAAGATVTDKATVGGLFVVNITVCLPEGVRGYLQIDGQKLIDSQDGQGLVGSLATGDASVPFGLPANAIEMQIVNGNSASRTVGFWLICTAA